MGAIIKLDLTSDVTHLIVGSTDSAKYRYVAKSRDDVKVFLPQWLEALRDVWMAGEDNLDVARLEREHRLPTFYGLKICLTGFDNRKNLRLGRGLVLTTCSGPETLHPRDHRRQRGGVPWRPNQVCHPSHRRNCLRQEIRLCPQLETESRLA